MTNIRKVRSFGNNHILLKIFDEKLNGYRKVIKEKAIYSGIIIGFVYFTIIAILGILFYIGAVLVVN